MQEALRPQTRAMSKMVDVGYNELIETYAIGANSTRI